VKKNIFYIITCILLCLTCEASACSLFFFGGDYTDDGANLFARIEDGNLNDENKLYLVSPAGKHKAGEEYHGCFCYIWTFTHDSYRYVSRRDDNLLGTCPVCSGTHDHQPFEEAGTNEFGLTLTATQSVDANPKIQEADPYLENGLSEAETATILLSECATAREAVMLLKQMIEESGIYEEGISVMLCDQREQWYVEAHASHCFLAVLLPRGVAFFQPNLSVLGLLDLDDTDHIIASEGIIELAQRAGTFVGDADKHIIDYRRSYNDYLVTVPHGATGEQVNVWRRNVTERLAVSLNYLEGTDVWNTENVLEDNDFIMTNIGEDGSIVSLHNRLKTGMIVSLDVLMKLLRCYPLGYSENVETHLYRFYPERDREFGTVEWGAMDNCQYTVFVPGYPMLLTDTWEGYKTGLPLTQLMAKDPDAWDDVDLERPLSALTSEKPETKDCYEMKGTYYALYYIRDWSGLWHVFPEGWEKSYSATFSALSNYLSYMDPGEEAVALTKERFTAMQKEFETRFESLTARLREETDPAVCRETATQEASRMAEEAQNLAMALYRHFVYGEDLPED
jgi:dipeptidase